MFGGRGVAGRSSSGCRDVRACIYEGATVFDAHHRASLKRAKSARCAHERCGLLKIPQPALWSAKGFSSWRSPRGETPFIAGSNGCFTSERLRPGESGAAKHRDHVRAGGAEPRHVTRLTQQGTSRDAYYAELAGIGANSSDAHGAAASAMSVVQGGGEKKKSATAVIPEGSGLRALPMWRPAESASGTTRHLRHGRQQLSRRTRACSQPLE